MLRLSLGLACLAIAFGACRDHRAMPGVDDAAPDSRVADAKLDAGVEAADVAVDRIDRSPDLAPDLAADLAPDTGLPDLAPDTGAPVDAAVPICGPGAPRDMLCLSYCDGIGRFCTGGRAQFPSADACRMACDAPTSTWACGSPGDVTGNSLFCRLSHLALAGVGGAATECPNAGPASPVCQ